MSEGGAAPKATTSLQEALAPKSVCFGCGPANPQGLHIRSFVADDDPDALVATFRPAPHHLAFPGVLNGGICGALLDCHSNWAAAVYLMKHGGHAALPCTVTADFAVTLKRPTPLDCDLQLRAKVVSNEADRALVEATITANGKVTATCRGTFVAVKEGHPAYHRW